MSTEPGKESFMEMLTEWEGQAVHHPGVLFEEREAEHLSGVENRGCNRGMACRHGHWRRRRQLGPRGDQAEGDWLLAGLARALRADEDRRGQEAATCRDAEVSKERQDYRRGTA